MYQQNSFDILVSFNYLMQQAPSSTISKDRNIYVHGEVINTCHSKITNACHSGEIHYSGIGVGGTWGLYEGLLSVPTGESRRLKLNTVINCCTRRGPFLANNLAVLGL